ncbi:S24/S26 family peptidase [Motilimonas pumila]|uniref:Peptidase S24/S26A/S26B/S26C domain-containing protein n=1 Tax=Motilimonas pumila TaxID=2303987 RepID=A0A418YAI0_9GAMM|nr:hypothetical protein D1Z90_18040 [Motilimonas pumila]
MFKLLKVTGTSMQPSLHHGDFVVVYSHFLNIQVGELVIAKHPSLPNMIKRVLKVDSKQRVLLAGDHSSSISSINIGWIPRSQITHKVFFRIRRY